MVIDNTNTKTYNNSNYIFYQNNIIKIKVIILVIKKTIVNSHDHLYNHHPYNYYINQSHHNNIYIIARALSQM